MIRRRRSSAPFWRYIASLGVVLGAAAAVPAPASAQPAPPARRYGTEFAIGGLVVGPMPLGSASADYVAPNGGLLPLFDTDMSLAPAFGLQTHLGFRLAPRVMAEATGSWIRGNARAEVVDDFEGASGVTLSESMSRFAVEGSIVLAVAERPRSAFFLRGGAGWMQELAQGSTLAERGIIGNVGAGVKYWWRVRPPVGPQGRGHRLGLRLDGHVIVRSKGLPLGPGGLHVAPAVSSELVVGF